ncbi:family 16 glycosylhydrolase [Flaviaesturariibacter amylovorans]
MTPFLLLLALAAGCKKGGNNGGGGNTPALPRISIEDLTQAEGNGGSNNFNFRVTLSEAASGPVTVYYTTNGGTGVATEDFTSVTNGSLTFAAGEREKLLAVPVVADDAREGDDVFTVTLSSPSGATLSRATATATIQNDDTRIPFTNAGYDAPTSYPGYSLVWSDDFNGPALNSTFWTNENGDGCPNICGWGNNELEYYTDRPDNLFFQDGKLVILAQKESYGGKQYTSSKILTRGKKTFKYGRIDIRAKLPKGKGIWPALWLLPQNNVFGGWPRSGEIDLMELVGHEPNKVYGTLHFGPGPGSQQISRGYTLPSGTFHDEFHVFSVEWKQDEIKWFVDGNLFSTARKADVGVNNWPFNEEFYLIFNLAVGGNWPGNPDASTYLPQWMVVDYIRVYQ